MARLVVVPDAWTGLRPPDDPELAATMRENAEQIIRAYGIPRTLMLDAALAAQIVRPGPLCIVTGV